jgi:hypothetical protein
MGKEGPTSIYLPAETEENHEKPVLMLTLGLVLGIF